MGRIADLLRVLFDDDVKHEERVSYAHANTLPPGSQVYFSDDVPANGIEKGKDGKWYELWDTRRKFANSIVGDGNVIVIRHGHGEPSTD